MFGRIPRALLLIILSVLCLVPLVAIGGESRRQQMMLGDNTERIFRENIRPAGMGGAFVAVADDEDAIFYNPAGLARINYWRFTFPDYLIGTDTKSFDNLTYLLGHVSDFSSMNSGTMSPEAIAAVDQLSHTRIHFFNDTSVKYIQPGFGFSTYLFTDALVETGAILLPEASWNVRGGLIETLSWALGGDVPGLGYLSVGTTFKATQIMHSVEERRNVLDLQNPEMTTLWGGGMDLGMMYQPTEQVTFAVMCADLYSRMLDEVTVPNLKFGFAYRPWWLNFDDLGAVLAVDVVELNWQGDNEFKNSPNNAAAINFSKFRVGVEFLLSGLIALRGGIHEGYPAAGFSLCTSFINVDYAYYGNELGTYPGQSVEWCQRISVDWHTGAKVAPPATPTATTTPTVTVTPTSTPTPMPRPTAQPTLTGKIPKLFGTFVGFTGTITVVPQLPDDLGTVETWTMQIMDRRGTVLQAYRGTGFPDKSFVWNGKYQGKRVSSKDQYPYTLNIKGADGMRTVEGTIIIVDTIPKLYTSKNYEVYPDKVYFSIKEPVANTKNWKLDIFDAANQVIRSYRSQEPLFKAFAWDAKNEEGMVVPNSGAYRYELNYLDSSGHQVLIADKIRPVKGQVYPSENRTTIKIGSILFDTGKAYLTAEMFDKVIKSAYLIQDEPNCESELEGHTDNTGSKSLNMKLSLVRSESVRRFLMDQQNVPQYQMTIKGFGPTKPIATNRTVDGRQKNRRVEVIIRIPQ